MKTKTINKKLIPMIEDQVKVGLCAGLTYIRPDIDKLSLDEITIMFGQEVITKLVKRSIKSKALKISKECVEDDGLNFNTDKFQLLIRNI